MNESQGPVKTDYRAARQKILDLCPEYFPIIEQVDKLFINQERAMEGVESNKGIGYKGIYKEDIKRLTGFGHLQLLTNYARLAVRYSMDGNLDIEVGVRLRDSTYSNDRRRDESHKMRMGIEFMGVDGKTPVGVIKKYADDDPFTGKAVRRKPVDQGLESLLEEIGGHIGIKVTSSSHMRRQ